MTQITHSLLKFRKPLVFDKTINMAKEIDDQWVLAPSQPCLRSAQVHLWRADLELPAPQMQFLAKFLSIDEQKRAARFRFDRDRHHFTVGRGLLRWILSKYLMIPPQELQFDYEAKGKPLLAPSCNPGQWQFNLSHSQGMALYAISQQQRVGVDLEQIRTIATDQLAARFFTTQEAAHLTNLPPDQKELAFFRYWTCKEAYLKACGDGLVGLDQVEIGLADPVQLLKVGRDRVDRWYLKELSPHPGYAAALAIAGKNPELIYWQFSPNHHLNNLDEVP